MQVPDPTAAQSSGERWRVSMALQRWSMRCAVSQGVAGLLITLSLWRVHSRFERHQSREMAGVDAAQSSMPFVFE
jgi:hypothetical protein